MKEKRRPDTDAVRVQLERSNHREHPQPMFATSSFVFESAEQARALFAGEQSGQMYSRYGNPNTDEFVEKLCRTEGPQDGVSTATGMAAIFASMAALLSCGDHIVASRSLFGSTYQILSQVLHRWGISCTWVNISDRAAWKSAVRPETKMLYAETPSNPALDVLDLEYLGDTRSIATHPATTTHSRLSEEERRAVRVSPGLIRLSVGLESVEDIIADIDQALKTVQY